MDVRKVPLRKARREEWHMLEGAGNSITRQHLLLKLRKRGRIRRLHPRTIALRTSNLGIRRIIVALAICGSGILRNNATL